MWTIYLWTSGLLVQFGRGGSECLEDLVFYQYSGTVSVTNNGHTCQAWSSQSPHEHDFNDDHLFADDESVAAARNYCRNIFEHSRPWCFTTHPYIKWGYCDFAICKDAYRQCGGVVQDDSGLIVAPDFDGDGLYDINVDCLWTITAPENYVIRYVIQFFEIEDSIADCFVDALMIFEKGNTDRLHYCGSSGTWQTIGETISNILYVEFYSDYSVNAEGFNFTFRRRKATNKVCKEVLTQSSGWIASPDLDGDGLYDFNLNCSWIIQVTEHTVIEFRLLYIDIWPSTACLSEYLDIYDFDTRVVLYCAYDFVSETNTYTTTSNVLVARFVSDNVNAKSGFKLKYEQASNERCLNDLTGYNGTVSVTNNGRTCQAWSAQTPHRHHYYKDRNFKMDGSVAEASNYCRELSMPGRPWCYTMDENIRWEYCTFRICDSTSLICGGVIQDKSGFILSPDVHDLADCIWVIQAEENQVISYKLDIYEMMDNDQCQAYTLMLFEKDAKVIWKTICDSIYLSLYGESRGNVLNIRYYKDDNVRPFSFQFYYLHVKAHNQTWSEILTNPSGWITSPDMDGDYVYDFNMNCLWTIQGDSNSVVFLTPVYIIIEYSPSCSNDFILVYDYYGTYFSTCGFKNDTDADSVESRTNHLYIQFTSNEIVSALGFNYSYKILARKDDCLNNLLVSGYSGTVSVTDHGLTCQYWFAQTPHVHDTLEEFPEWAHENYNYCRSFYHHLPWCYTTDPYIRVDLCTYSICNETYKKCQDVLESRIGVIVAPDYNNDGLYDVNIDCLWIVEASTDHMIQFHIYFVDIESTTACRNDFLKIWERTTPSSRYPIVVCGTYTLQSGETKSNALYVQFYSDSSTQAMGFNMSYIQLQASVLSDKDCNEIIRNRSGSITTPDKDADGLYDFNLDCLWTVEVDAGMRIQYWFVYADLDVVYQKSICSMDYIEIYDGFEGYYRLCGADVGGITASMKTSSNVLIVKFKSDFMNSAKGFNLTYEEIESTTDCFDKLKSTPYSGRESVTNNGIQCQAWSDQTPHNHSVNRDLFFPLDGSVAKARNYCRDIWGDGRPWCYTTDEDIRMGFCSLRICNESFKSCGGLLFGSTGTIVSPGSIGDRNYDLNVDCLWSVVAAQNKVIRYSIDHYNIDLSSECHKDALLIFEGGKSSRSIFCGERTEQLLGETSNNKLYIHFYSDDTVAASGFQLKFVTREVPVIPCGGFLNGAYGWISAPDRDGDGFYDFNIDCQWYMTVEKQKRIKLEVIYIRLDPCEDEENFDTLYIAEVEDYAIHMMICGNSIYERGHWATTKNGRIWATNHNHLFIRFISNNLEVGNGFNLTYKAEESREFYFRFTGDGWISPPDVQKDELDDNLKISCQWFVEAPKNNAVELGIYFISAAGSYPFCRTDALIIRNRWINEKFCGTHGRQAIIHTKDNYAEVYFVAHFYTQGVSFLLDYKTVNASKTRVYTELYSLAGGITVDLNTNGVYDYHLKLSWIIDAHYNSNILFRLIYLDIEESNYCVNDYLAIGLSAAGYRGGFSLLCGIGFKNIITTVSRFTVIGFVSDHTINRFGFNISFSQITGVTSNECGGVLTSSSEYLMSVDIDGDGYYDDGQYCLWIIRLGFTQVIVFEVLKLDIYETPECQSDFLESYEDHRYIGKYCGKNTVSRFTTESNILYVRFHADSIRSGRGFEAVYFQAEDAKDCLPDYRCLLTDKTIQPNYVCDSYSDCYYGDDERFCNFRCPSGCSCTGLTVDCTGIHSCGFQRKSASYLNQTFVLSSSIRILDVSTNDKILIDLNLERQTLPHLTHLNLSFCEITDLPVLTFSSMTSLIGLDLTFNRMRRLKANMFLKLANLELPLLRGNSESLIIESEAFVGLVSLRYLDLSALQIERISKGSFASLRLKELTIYDSNITEIQSYSLDNLVAEGIYLNSSIIDTFKESMFQGGTNISVFVTDEYKFCCVRPSSVPGENCYPPKDEISSCDDLIRNKILRPIILVLGFFCLLSNVSSVVFRFKHHAKQLKFCYGIAVSHLAVSDSLLGIYLIIIGITDKRYRGIYIYNDESWRSSGWCQLAGILSTVSCEASLLFICLITADRFLVVKYPFRQKRLTRKNGIVLVIVCWFIALCLAILPVALPSSFKGEFYSKSGLCLGLPLTRVRSPGWGFSFGIFIVFNTLTCLMIAIGQWTLYREIKASKKALGDSRSKSTSDARITRNLLLVIITNFVSWLPVGLLGVLASANYAIPGDVYAWIAVLVLPVNSAVNPILYTLSELLQKKKVVQREQDSRATECQLIADDLVKCTGLWNISAFRSYKGRAPGYHPLTDVLTEEWFGRKQRLCVAVNICKHVHKLHDWKLTQEDLTIEDIFIKNFNQDTVAWGLCISSNGEKYSKTADT